VSKLKLKNKATINEEFINEVHWNFPNVYFLKISSFKWHDCCKFLSLKNHFTLQNLIFCMYFFINHMFRIFIGWFINVYD
jgi:hypothetical protein